MKQTSFYAFCGRMAAHAKTERNKEKQRLLDFFNTNQNKSGLIMEFNKSVI